MIPLKILMKKWLLLNHQPNHKWLFDFITVKMHWFFNGIDEFIEPDRMRYE